MGDRANIAVQANGKRVWLYTHWRGYDLPAILRDALNRGSDRWSDGQYLARIIFQEMLDGDTGTTGFGISAEIGDNEYPILVCDTDDETVWIESKGGDLIRKMPMAAFAALSDDACDRSALQVPA